MCQQICGTIAELGPERFLQVFQKRFVNLSRCRPFHPENLVGFLTSREGVMTKEPTHVITGNELKTGIGPGRVRAKAVSGEAQ